MAELARRGGSMQDRFGRELLGRFRANPAVADSWYSAERFAIGYRRADGDGACWAHLGNLYAECAGLAGARREDVLDNYVASVAEPPPVPTDWASAVPLLRPMLCGAAFGRTPPSAACRGEDDLVRRTAAPLLDELVVLDRPAGVGYVTAPLAAEWGVGLDEVFAAAHGNLSGDVAGGATPPPGRRELLRFVDDGAAYWVPRLLLSGWLSGLADRLGGRPVAFAPDRDSLLVARDGPALAGIFDIVAAEYAEAVHPISPVGYTIDDSGRLVPYRPRHGPAATAACNAERLLAAREYDTQADLLRAAGEPVTVASYLLTDGADGAVASVSTWREDTDTLLPVTDRVVLVAADRRQSWLVDWDRLVAAGVGRPVPGLVPSRHRVCRWPRGRRRAALLAGAVHRIGGADG